MYIYMYVCYLLCIINQIDDLYDTSSTTLDNAHSGEQQLVETVERSEKTRYHILIFATSLAVLLLALDVMTP
jgi:hypothetical protein